MTSPRPTHPYSPPLTPSTSRPSRALTTTPSRRPSSLRLAVRQRIRRSSSTTCSTAPSGMRSSPCLRMCSLSTTCSPRRLPPTARERSARPPFPVHIISPRPPLTTNVSSVYHRLMNSHYDRRGDDDSATPPLSRPLRLPTLPEDPFQGGAAPQLLGEVRGSACQVAEAAMLIARPVPPVLADPGAYLHCQCKVGLCQNGQQERCHCRIPGSSHWTTVTLLSPALPTGGGPDVVLVPYPYCIHLRPPGT